MSSADTSGDSESSVVVTRKAKSGRSTVKPGPSKAKAPEQDLDLDSNSSASSNSDDPDSASEAEKDRDDSPVLSHAERRRQKKKQQLVDEEDEQKKTNAETKSVKNTAELAPSRVPKRQNSVWVGNLSFKTTPDALRQFFDGCGEITRIHMPMKLTSAGPSAKGAVKENRGFAYVDLATPNQKAVAISLSENHLDGRRLLIKDGDDFNGRPSTSANASTEGASDKKSNSITASKTAQKILRAQKQPAGPTLFFGNLGFETADQSLRELLTRNHKRADKEVEEEVEEASDDVKSKWIRKVRLGTFEDSGKCKGWAFVDFHRNEDATEALVNVRNHHLDGRQLVVEYASPDAVRRGGGGPRPEKEGAGKGNGKGEFRRDTKPKRKAYQGRGEEEEDVHMDVEADLADEQPAKRRRTDASRGDGVAVRTHRYSKDGKPVKARPKPGAALALAKRETATIVPSQGQKIVF